MSIIVWATKILNTVCTESTTYQPLKSLFQIRYAGAIAKNKIIFDVNASFIKFQIDGYLSHSTNHVIIAIVTDPTTQVKNQIISKIIHSTGWLSTFWSVICWSAWVNKPQKSTEITKIRTHTSHPTIIHPISLIQIADQEISGAW